MSTLTHSEGLGHKADRFVNDQLIRIGALVQTRVRLTIAQINAGADLIAAIPGHKLRLCDAAAIAVGGAVAAVTTVDISATLAGSARKLVAFAQASLTQSALLRAGASGAAILADGASFTANDANTAIRATITGSSITTATHVDFLLVYTIEEA